MTKINIEQFRQVRNAFDCLKDNSRKLHRLDERYCNGEIEEEKYLKAVELQLKDAKETLEVCGIDLQLFHQSDPRGCSLYLIDNTMDNTNYTNGIAIF